MDFIELNRNIRELEKGFWRQTAFEDLQVQYCEERLYALRCKRGTPNEHICLIREQSEDAAISRAAFDMHRCGETDATVKALRAKLKVAEEALGESRVAVCHTCDQKHMCGHGTDKFDPCCIYKDIDNALATIRDAAVAK